MSTAIRTSTTTSTDRSTSRKFRIARQTGQVKALPASVDREAGRTTRSIGKALHTAIRRRHKNTEEINLHEPTRRATITAGVPKLQAARLETRERAPTHQQHSNAVMAA